MKLRKLLEKWIDFRDDVLNEVVSRYIWFQVFNFGFNVLLNKNILLLVKLFDFVSRILHIIMFSVDAVKVCLELFELFIIILVKRYKYIAIVPDFLCFFIFEIFILQAWPKRIYTNHKIPCRWILFFWYFSASVVK